MISVDNGSPRRREELIAVVRLVATVLLTVARVAHWASNTLSVLMCHAVASRGLTREAIAVETGLHKETVNS
jgi:hypothetical protein